MRRATASFIRTERVKGTAGTTSGSARLPHRLRALPVLPVPQNLLLTAAILPTGSSTKIPISTIRTDTPPAANSILKTSAVRTIKFPKGISFPPSALPRLSRRNLRLPRQSPCRRKSPLPITRIFMRRRRKTSPIPNARKRSLRTRRQTPPRLPATSIATTFPPIFLLRHRVRRMSRRSRMSPLRRTRPRRPPKRLPKRRRPICRSMAGQRERGRG